MPHCLQLTKANGESSVDLDSTVHAMFNNELIVLQGFKKQTKKNIYLATKSFSLLLFFCLLEINSSEK